MEQAVGVLGEPGQRSPATRCRRRRRNSSDYSSTQYDDLTGKLQGSLDYFEGVPVVSFGWVALFILIYIILIGPVDYLFLKKVVKPARMDVGHVSDDRHYRQRRRLLRGLRAQGQGPARSTRSTWSTSTWPASAIDGNTWFTLFSPRIQNYTIGVEPAGPEDGEPSVWTPSTECRPRHDRELAGHVEQNQYGGSSGGLFSKRYKYQSGTDPVDPNRDLYAAGLEGVPIQVWTTKAFHAEWSAPLDPAKPPIVADLS